MQAKTLTVVQAAAQMGVTRQAIEARIKAGTVKAKKVDGHWRIKPGDLAYKPAGRGKKWKNEKIKQSKRTPVKTPGGPVDKQVNPTVSA